MNHEEFWQIIDTAREEANGWEKMHGTLLERLSALDLPALMLWKRIFDAYQRLSCKNKLRAAACLINDDCSDGAFDYFRAWLTAQGRTVFLEALKDPETLAKVDVVGDGVGFEDMLYAPAQAYFRKLELLPGDGNGNFDRFYAELNKYPLPEEVKAAMASEIRYAEDIDAQWQKEDLAGLLPKLYDVYGGSEYLKHDTEEEKEIALWLPLALDARIAKLEEWHEADDHSLIVRAIETIPAEKRGYTLTGLYARALNNLDRETEGLAALLSVEDEGKDDSLWHYRVGYALFYTGRAAEALEHINRAIEMGDRHPGTHELLRVIKGALAPDGMPKRGASPQYRCVSCGREQSFEGLCYFCCPAMR